MPPRPKFMYVASSPCATAWQHFNVPRHTFLGTHTSSMWSSGAIFLSRVLFSFARTSKRYDSSSINFRRRFNLSQPTPSPASTCWRTSFKNAWFSALLVDRSAFCWRWISSCVWRGPECLMSGVRSTSARRPGNESNGNSFSRVDFVGCCWLLLCWFDCCSEGEKIF